MTKCVIFTNYSKKSDKICVHEFNKSLLSRLVSNSELSVELPVSLSELKSVLSLDQILTFCILNWAF